MIEENIISEIKNISIDNDLEYINALISQFLQLYKNMCVLSKELVNKTDITTKISQLYDIKLKIIFCQQMSKDK